MIGDREPIVVQRQLPGMGRAMRYIIAIADDDRRPLECDVMRNAFVRGAENSFGEVR